MAEFETIIFEKREGVCHIILNRPRQLNAYNVRMRDDLYEALQAVRDDPEIRVTVFRGAGEKAFCAGADLTEFLTAPPPAAARRVRFERDVWGLFLGISKPFIAAMHGYVLGSGIEIALCCDIRLASDDARFGLPEASLGIIPAAGGTQTLPRVIGRAAALDMLLSTRMVPAEEALRLGLVNRLLPRAELFPVAERLAEDIKKCDPAVISGIKQAVTRGLDLTLEQGLELEARLAAEAKALRKEPHAR